MSVVKEIASGWWNLLTDNKQMEPIANYRLNICHKCPLNVDNVCDGSKQGKAVKSFVYRGEHRKEGTIYNGCGCPLSAKVNSPTSQCPLGKW